MATDLLVDAHVHVASADETAYPRHPTGAGSDWWLQPTGVEELTQNMDAVGMDRAVVVQAVGAYGYDCAYAAAAVAASGGRLALVGAIDMTSPDVEAEIVTLLGNAPLAGVRLFGVGASGADWLTNGSGEAAWRVADDEGLVLVPTIFPDRLGALRALMEKRPKVVVALDHCAFPDFGGPDAMDNLTAMAELPTLHLKVTSHNLDDGNDPSILVETLAAAFGPGRLCWGSDHPQHQSRTYAEMADLGRRAARNLTPPERASFLGGNALGLWW